MGAAPQFQLCLVGGTFDRLHAGHRLLLDAACRSAERVEIHVTSDVMADQKSVNMQSFETRRDELLNWVEVNAPTRVSVHELADQHGPAPSPPQGGLHRSDTETRAECERINDKRAANGLAPLHIIEVAHMKDINGLIISSSRIRNGAVDMEGHPWFSEAWEGQTLPHAPSSRA